MKLRVVSRNAVFREALVAVCGARGVVISDTHGSCAGLTQMDSGDVLLFHAFNDFSNLPDTIAGLARSWPDLRILLLVPQRETESLRHHIGQQVSAIIPETVTAEILISALILAQQGYRMLADGKFSTNHPAEQSDAALPDAKPVSRPKPAVAPTHPLSEREAAILAGLCSGGSNKAIANALGISDATVKVHLRTSFRKIGVKNRTQAAMWASQHLQRV